MTAIDDIVGRLRARMPAGTGGFLAWWGQSLASWLPLGWRKRLGLTRARLLLTPLQDEVQLQWQEGTAVRPLAMLPLPITPEQLERVLDRRLAALPRWMLLPDAQTLRRRLQLPAAAAERLHDVVRFELDRQTPFTAETACFDEVIRERRPDGQLEVELVAMPRRSVAEARSALGPLAGTLAGIDILDGSGHAPVGVNLLDPLQRGATQSPWRHWHWGLLAIAVGALWLTGWQVLDNRRQAAEDYEARIRAQAPAARVVAAQRQQLADLVVGMAALDQARAGRPTTVEILDELSTRLPDSTYLEKLSIEGDRLLLIGLSSEASGLVAKLQGSRLWRSPALSGALQPDPGSRRDRFTLTAELVGAASLPAGNATGGGDDQSRR